MKIMNHEVFREERGVEIVEFAMVLPLLTLLLAGGIEFGRAFYTYNILTKSVRNAARYLSAVQIHSDGTIDPSYITNTKNLAVYGTIDTSGPKILSDINPSQITVPNGTVAGGVNEIYVTVSANYSYAPIFKFLLPNCTFKPKITMAFVGTFNPN